MKTTLAFRFRPALIALGFAFGLLSVSLSAADAMAQALPLTASFVKDTPGERGGPNAVILTNTSKETLNVKATILLSVAAHNTDRSVKLEGTVEVGGNWKISDLAVEDRIILSAEGFENLEVTVPSAE